MGRIDDVLNVSGHRLGTMEIESALVANTDWWPKPRWSAGRDDLTGEAVVRLRRAEEARARPATEAQEDRARSCATGSARRSAPIAKPEGHPLRRQPAQDALRQDHAPAAALDRQGRGDHAGRLHAGESGDPGAAEADRVT